MFKVTDDPTFTHRVTIMVPVDGGHAEQTLQTTFRAIPDEEADGFDLNEVSGIKEFLKRIIVSMDDLAGADDKPMPYSDGLRDKLLELPYFRLGNVRAYSAAMTKAKAGN